MPNYNAADHNAYLAQVTGSALINYQTDPTWMFQVAQQTAEYNKSLSEARAQVWARGIKDPYSGFNFSPLQASHGVHSLQNSVVPLMGAPLTVRSGSTTPMCANGPPVWPTCLQKCLPSSRMAISKTQF